MLSRIYFREKTRYIKSLYNASKGKTNAVRLRTSNFLSSSFNCNHYRGIPMKIVIVEDHQFFREIISSTLGAYFPASEIYSYSSSETAMPEIKNHQFDIAIIDISLPGENGLKLTQKIRTIHPDMKIIIYTNHNLPEYRDAAFEFGADHFMSKKDKNPKDLAFAIESMF